MPQDFDTSDPLGALMAEWRQITMQLWIGVVAAALLSFAGTPFTSVAWVVVAAVLGMAIVQLGQTVVIVGNELRKSLTSPSQDSEEKR